jgi:hypothetical protein
MSNNIGHAPEPELRIKLDPAIWSRGYDDGFASRKGDTRCLSYASGYIEGVARRKRLAEEDRPEDPAVFPGN